MFVEQENIICTLKWPSLIAKNGKKIFILQRKKFGRIDSWKNKQLNIAKTSLLKLAI
jgi:hypothetical protein